MEITVTDRHSKSNGQGQGSKWCRPATRLSIYLRDGAACVYCGAAVEDGALLSLDHLKPHSKGGSNDVTNLVTCCHSCNSSRGKRSVAAFARDVAAYLNHGTTAEEIIKHVRACARRALPRDEARELLSRRGTVARVLASR